MSYQFVDGKGPRWLGDELPNLPPELAHAASLPPKITPKYVFFFGYEGPEPECCLQQWYPSPFVSPSGQKFHTSEQYMMYRKAQLMKDAATAAKILDARTPAEAKRLGREVKGFDQKVWDENCEAVVEEGNFLKFEQNRQLGEVLLGMGERRLVETSPNDRVWGVGFNSEEAEGREEEWGKNLLGKALERVRERLRERK